jgi:hypothetical protein
MWGVLLLNMLQIHLHQGINHLLLKQKLQLHQEFKCPLLK